MMFGGCEVGIGGEGSTFKQHTRLIIERLTITRTPDVHKINSVLDFTGKKLALSFITHEFVDGY